MSKALRRDLPDVSGMLLALDRVEGARRWDSLSRRWSARSFLKLVDSSASSFDVGV